MKSLFYNFITLIAVSTITPSYPMDIEVEDDGAAKEVTTRKNGRKRKISEKAAVLAHANQSTELDEEPPIKKKPKNKIFVCDTCKKEFSDKSNFTRHLRIHTKEKPYRCAYQGCKKQYGDSSTLSRHEKTHNPNPEKKYKCPHCPKTFVTPVRKTHLETHNPSMSYKCQFPGCTVGFKKKSSLTTHQKEHVAPLEECATISSAPTDPEEDENRILPPSIRYKPLTPEDVPLPSLIS